jgi:hypothetical protein
MLDKDKLFIIINVGIKYLDVKDVPDYISEISNLTKDFDNSVKVFIVPTKESSEIKFEFFNEQVLSSIDLDEAKSIVEKLEKMVNDGLNRES